MSVIFQRYPNWRAIYINDASTDKTDELFHEITEKYNTTNRFTYIKNTERKFQSHNKYYAYKQVKDLEIVCILDGDDWLYHRNVLLILNNAYNTYHNSQIITSRYRIRENNIEKDNLAYNTYSQMDIQHSLIRLNPKWRLQHLKTGFGYLFKSIPKTYLQYNNEWLDRCTDIAEMYSVIELSNGQLRVIPDILYVYNKDNSILHPQSYYNDRFSDKRKTFEHHIHNLPRLKYTLPLTYIINIPKETNKQLSLKRQMLYIEHTNYSFIPAIDGSTNNDIQQIITQYNQNFKSEKTNSYLPNKPSIYINQKKHITPSSLGLILSVRKTLQTFLSSTNDTHFLLLEDDVYVHNQFKKKYHINNDYLKDKDLIYIGCQNNQIDIYHRIHKETSNTLNKLYDCQLEPYLIYGGYSIIISRKLAEYIASLPLEFYVEGNMSWDLVLNYIRQTNKNFTFYIYHEQLFIPEVRKEGIQNKRDNSFYTQRNINLSHYLVD